MNQIIKRIINRYSFSETSENTVSNNFPSIKLFGNFMDTKFPEPVNFRRKFFIIINMDIHSIHIHRYYTIFLKNFLVTIFKHMQRRKYI